MLPTSSSTRLQWGKSGWPPADMFRPLFRLGLSPRRKIIAGNVPRTQIRAVAHRGITAIPAPERKRLLLDNRPAGALQSALLDELETSHCGLLPKSAFTAMAAAQTYRDAFMAYQMVTAEKTIGRAILLAGNGHVRSDRGVPYFQRKMAPAKATITVMFIEVRPGKTKPEDYVPRAPDGKPATDYIYLTRAPPRPDPCIEMRKRFKSPK